MDQPQIQYVSDADGKNVGVIVPIDVWREMESELETAYLLKSPAMKARLMAAKDREGGMSLDEVTERLGIRS